MTVSFVTGVVTVYKWLRGRRSRSRLPRAHEHFLCVSLAADERYLPRLPDSLPRLSRVESLVRERWGRLSLADVKAIFADHAGHPTSICRHPTPGPRASIESIYSVIGEPARGHLHVSVVNPCANEYFTYEL